MPEASPEASTVRFLAPGGATAGLGALVGQNQVVTCAHVVNAALGLNLRAQIMPNGSVRLDFPLLTGTRPVTATVTVWRPPPTDSAAGDDVAGLVLDEVPEGAIPARLVVETPRPGRKARVFGYPGTPPRPDGGWAETAVRGTVGNGRLQLDAVADSALKIQPGFSGSPVYDADSGRVTGILAAAPSGAAAGRDSYAIGADRLRLAWPEVLAGHWQRTATPQHRGGLTILHVSDMCFGAAADGLAAADLAGHPLFGRLHADLAALAKDHDLRPDLLVVTGNQTEQGKPSEFRHAAAFLSALAEAAEIPRRHVAVVPGDRDVNRQACAAYFTEKEADEEPPTPPYWPKWRHFARSFGDFYADVPGVTFTPDEPFTLFELPDLGVVVAGLNSTIADSHRPEDHYGQVSDQQLRWFARKLAEYQGWVRIAALHHDQPRDATDLDLVLGTDKLASLILHGHTPEPGLRRLPSGLLALSSGEGTGHYQLVTLRRDGITRYARQYAPRQRRWVGDTGISPDGAAWTVRDDHDVPGFAEPSATRTGPAEGSGAADGTRADRNEFLERVTEATRVRLPSAIITPRPDENYLRVSVSRDGGVAQWPIGVIDGPPDTEAIDAFADGVHARFAAADPTVASELVYGVPAAPAGLADHARRRGIRLKSLVEYQGLLDLSGLAERQRERLAADRIYPERLYVDQRYRIVHGGGHADEVRTGLVDRAVAWLQADSARLVVVLGDFGRGKTSFLRQLTRVLPGRLRGVTPVLVELRGLEKAPTLDELLAQHLVRQGVEDISVEKLRYMVTSGRVALLFDGFDELELRVGYENAAEYLQTLLASVAGSAKAILTSRTQHFRSTEQVRTALGRLVESRSASRVVLLEEFSDDQILEFLTKLYDGDASHAAGRLSLIRGVGNLADLAHNPRMLTFVADLPEDRLRAVADAAGQVTAAGLYAQIIDSWLDLEVARQRHSGGLPSITKEERFEACTALALRLWQSEDPKLALADLSAEVTAALSGLAERGYSEEQAAHSIASGSLLVRTEDGAFTFIHQSIMEWLVASAAARDPGRILGTRQMSRLMTEFFTDLAGREAVLEWANATLAAGDATEPAVQNAVTVSSPPASQPSLPGPASPPVRPDLSGVDLSGVDLRGQDLNGRDLRGAGLRGADLRGMRLVGPDLAGADLTDADLSGVTMVGGSLDRAVLSGSVWTRAAIVGTSGVDHSAPELSVAAIAGRDHAEPMFVPPGECTGVAFSPDGALLAVARGNTVQIVDVGSDSILRVLRGHDRQVNAVAFAPDGRLLATASSDNTARTWDAATGQPRAVLGEHDGWVTAVAFAPDARLLATGSRDGSARTWDAATGARRATINEHRGPVTAVAFSPDGTLLATASSDNTARTWDAATGARRATFTGHTRGVTDVAFSPDGALLATASGDRTIRTWDIGTGTERTTLAEDQLQVTAIAFSPDGTLLATASGTRVRILDAVTGTRETTFREHYLRVTGVAFSPDGSLLATASMDGAHIWRVATGTERATLTKSAAVVTGVAFSPDGSLLATASDDGTARTWSSVTGTHRSTFSGHARRVGGIAFSPDGSLLATVSDDGTARTWNATTGAVRHRHRHGGAAAVAFSAHGLLATASTDGSMRLWEAATGADAGDIELARKAGGAYTMAFSPDGSLLATASDSESVVIWDVASRTALATLDTMFIFGRLNAVAFSPDGKLVATASPHGNVRIWDARTGAHQRSIGAHELAMNAVAFSADGSVLATASDDGTARTWRAGTGERVATLVGHADPVTAVAFSPDGALLATGSSDGTARIWDAASGAGLATLLALPGGGHATLLPEGGYKLSGDTGEDIWWAIKLYRFSPGELDRHIARLRRVPGEVPITGQSGA